MDGIREYILGVTAAALLCSILSSVPGAHEKMVKMLCGIFLAFTVLRPVASAEIKDWLPALEEISRQGESASDEGWEYASAARRQLIKQEMEAYILDKASAYNLVPSVTVEISESEPFVPERVHISGVISPYAKQQLSRIMEADLGIAKENQRWTG